MKIHLHTFLRLLKNTCSAKHAELVFFDQQNTPGKKAGGNLLLSFFFPKGSLYPHLISYIIAGFAVIITKLTYLI